MGRLQKLLSKPIQDKNTTENILQQHDLIYVSSSMQGWRKKMEDIHTIEINIPGFSNYSFFGIYDGHCGKDTAQYISKNLHHNIFKKLDELGEKNIENAIKDAFMKTDDDWKIEIGIEPSSDEYDVKKSIYSAKSSGSTAVIAVVTPDKIVYVGNTGDSRAVMSVAGLAVPLSEDHKPYNENESQRIKQAGGYIIENRVMGLNLSRAFGDFQCKENYDKKPEEQMIIAQPDVKSYKINTSTDFLVLACDGIWDCMSSQEVIDFIYEEIQLNHDLSKACENLLNRCLNYYNASHCLTSTDNMTIIIIGFLHGLEKEKWLEQISYRCANEE
ncbi:phosphatase 2C-like domain-containing protein [Glomus cerebriforme]|uniref:Phosphatase 2C-like domain-containing protein n=1 Tax=Glomus cerebriforme TaxID=658196 RepID=A0A397SC44_9GLOM|nr:phosphatase 2C-like domain-containing protein [Glomus cerebriforme]